IENAWPVLMLLGSACRAIQPATASAAASAARCASAWIECSIVISTPKAANPAMTGIRIASLSRTTPRLHALVAVMVMLAPSYRSDRELGRMTDIAQIDEASLSPERVICQEGLCPVYRVLQAVRRLSAASEGNPRIGSCQFAPGPQCSDRERSPFHLPSSARR